MRIVVVPASQLPAFAARAAKNPAGALAPDGPFQVIPARERGRSIASSTSAASRRHIVASPAGVDLCAGGPGRAPCGSGLGPGYVPAVPAGDQTLLGIQMPVYRGGVVPKTVAARRAAFIGWSPSGSCRRSSWTRALEAHPGTAVTLRYVRGASAVAFSSGKAPRGAQSLTTDLHNGWTVTRPTPWPATGLFANRNALGLLIAGIAAEPAARPARRRAGNGPHAGASAWCASRRVELRDQAAELRATVAELEAAQAVKDEFLGLVSHELRTPLTSISGYTELLQEEELTDDQRDYLNVIDRNSARLLSLVEDLLVMAQIQSGGLPLQLGEVILGDLIARSGEAAGRSPRARSIGLEIDAEPGVAAQGDPVRLGQVLDNLVSNAIKYTPNGGDVTITMTHTGETATIAVSDTGIGIPKDEQDQMFGRFFRTSNARTRHRGHGPRPRDHTRNRRGPRRHDRLRQHRGNRHDLPHHPAARPRRRPRRGLDQPIGSRSSRGPAASSPGGHSSPNFVKFPRSAPPAGGSGPCTRPRSARSSRGRGRRRARPGSSSAPRSRRPGRCGTRRRRARPDSAASSSARVCRMLIRLPTPNGPPTQPVLTSQQVDAVALDLPPQQVGVDAGWWTMNGAPKQALKVISGSLPRPASVPAILDV